MRALLAIASTLCVLAGCDTARTNTQPGPFAQEVLTAAQGYKHLELVSTQERLAPELCRAVDSVTSQSRAGATSPHGRKLYLMWARDAQTYFDTPDVHAALGQTLVKQSFEARQELTTAQAPGETIAHLTTGNQTEFFVMYKADPSDTRTDNGWVYGIVSADLSRTIASGRLATCMACHTKRETRLFGMRDAK